MRDEDLGGLRAIRSTPRLPGAGPTQLRGAAPIPAARWKFTVRGSG
jgi:hypothetical protein